MVSNLFHGAMALWVFVALGLSGLIAYQLSNEPVASPANEASAPINPQDDPISVTAKVAAWTPSKDLVEKIAARPLFSDSRRPAPLGGDGRVVVRATSDDGPALELIGTMIIGDEPTALLRHPTEGVLRRRLGEVIDGWKLVDIQDHRVSLEGDDGIEAVVINDPLIEEREPPESTKRGKVEGQDSAETSGEGNSA